MDTNNPAEMIPYAEIIIKALNGLTLKEADRILSFTKTQLFSNAVIGSSDVEITTDEKEEPDVA